MPADFIPRAYQAPAVDFMLNTPRCALWAGMGLGKEQPVSEPVMTPSGWRPIGDIVPGDYVYGSAGTPVKVTGVFPQGVKNVFRVGFTDGSWTRAGAEHLWAVRTPRQKHDGLPGQVLSTKEILQAGLRDPQKNLRFGIPLTAPVQRPEAAFPIEPYLLGVLLGDGCVRPYGAVAITSDNEILGNWEGRYEPHESPGIGTLHLSTPKLRAAIKTLGLAGKRSWEKHVPEMYFFGSAPQRLALLQGLLDTDGHHMADGGLGFCSTAEDLVDAVVFLAQSLGGIARNKTNRVTQHQGGEGRRSWRVNVKLPAELAPFRLSRKLDKWVRPTKYPPVRLLNSIIPDGTEESVCISVDSPDHLYLTRGHILTHNTVSVLTALDALYLAGESAPTLVLAPLRVARSTWGAETKKWNHLSCLDVVPIVGAVKDRARALQQDAPIFTTNYENLEWLTEQWGDRWPYRIVVADEATKLKGVRLSFQTSTKGKEFLRGQGGKRARALGKIAHSHTARFIELTGTPAPNGLKDLWGQLWFLDGGRRLGRSYEAFKQRWFETGYDGRTLIPREHAESQIHAALADLCMTIDAKDYFDLKDPVVNVVTVQLPPAARKLYREMEKEMFAQIAADRTASAVNAAGKTQKCLQLAAGAIYVDPDVESDTDPKAKEWRAVHDAKLEALDDIIGEACGAPVIVVYEFRSDLERLKRAFPEGRALVTPKDEEDFKAGKIPVLFTHPKSAGHGIDGFQHVCNQMVFFTRNWSLEDYQQIVERIGPVRQLQAGMDRPVFLHHIVAEGTVDELVAERLEGKRDVQEILLSAMKRRS